MDKIDWNWVKKELFEKERIPPASKKYGIKSVIHISVDRALKDAKALAKPRTISITKKISDIKFPGKKVSAYLKGATHACLFLVTIGEGLEKKASDWMSKGEPLYGYLLDSIGSLAVESLAESLEGRLRKSYRTKGKSVSMRLSPGYCDWPIEEQFYLDEELDFSRIGVSLNEKCMMVPKKSISAIVGIGPKELFAKTLSQCTICNKKDCDYRRKS